MSIRRKDEHVEPFDRPDTYEELAFRMRAFHLARVDELPAIELYLDQVLSLIADELAPLYEPGEKIVTGSMVNNYVKQHVIERPTRKRYSRRHLAKLIFVCVLKRVLSIAQIGQVLHVMDASDIDTTVAYNELAFALEQALAARFPTESGARPIHALPSIHLVGADGSPVDERLTSLLESSVSLAADKVYVDKMLALESHREHLAAEPES